MRFRFHLSTWIVLFLAASILLGLHISPQEYRVKAGYNELHVITYGYPIICSEQESHHSGSSSMDAQPFALFNFIIILLPLAFFLEPDSRRKCSIKSTRVVFSLLVALGIGAALGIESYTRTQFLASSTRMDTNLATEYEKQEFYRRGWPYAGYVGIVERSKEPGKVILNTSSGDPQILNKSQLDDPVKLGEKIPVSWPMVLANLLAAFFIAATIFILTLRTVTWMTEKFGRSKSSALESPD